VLQDVAFEATQKMWLKGVLKNFKEFFFISEFVLRLFFRVQNLTLTLQF
jgi:hypothetical protein